MMRAKNYETVSKFVKVMPKILWPLFPEHGVHDSGSSIFSWSYSFHRVWLNTGWYCHISVPQSVSLSVCDDVYCGSQGRCRELKVVPSRFQRGALLQTVTVGGIVQPQHNAKYRTAGISASGIDMDRVVRPWPWLFQTRHFRRFGSADVPHAYGRTSSITSINQSIKQSILFLTWP